MHKIFKILLSLIIFIETAYYFYPEPSLPKGVVIDYISVDKSAHRMDVYSNQILIKSYTISLGRGVWGWKDTDWNNITPTGDYIIDTKFTNSSFHKALTISFGQQIEIHGARNHLGFIGKFHRLIDWTKGCIAVTNKEIEELYEKVPVGTKISIHE